MILNPEQRDTEIALENDGIRRTNLSDVYSTRVKKTYRFKFEKRQMNFFSFSCLYSDIQYNNNTIFYYELFPNFFPFYFFSFVFKKEVQK